MARPHIEFVQCQNIAWERQPDGSEVKRLNADPENGEETLIVRYPAGFVQRPGRPEDRAEEYFLLERAMTIEGVPVGYHGYGFLPRGEATGARETDIGASLLLFRHGRGDPNSVTGVAEAIRIDTPAMPWDMSIGDAKLGHLRLARKILRLGPNDSGRTFLLAGMPHGVPQVEALPAEKHDHCEEMLMLSGEMWAPEGLMRPGAYFFRPPGIRHGPHVSPNGFFQIMRSPGVNTIVTQWEKDLSPLPIGAPYAPVLPDGMPESWGREWRGAPAF